MSSPATTTGRRITRDIVWQIAAYAVSLVLGVVATAVLARELGEHGFGEWSTIFAAVQIAKFVADMGIEQIAVREASRDVARERSWLGTLLALRIALSVPAALLCAAVLLAIADSGKMRVAAVLGAATLLLTGPGVLVTAVFQLRVRNWVSQAFLLANSIVWTAAVVAIAGEDGGLVAFTIAFLAAFAITGAAEFAVAMRVGGVEFGEARRLSRPLLRMALPLGIAALLTIAYGRVGQLIVFQVAGPRDAGLFGAVSRVFTQGILLPAAVMTTLYPVIAANLERDRDRARRLVLAAGEYLLVLTLGVVALAAAEARPIVDLLFGTRFRDAAPALPIMMVAFVAASLGFLATNICVLVDRQRYLLRMATAALVMTVVLDLALVPSGGFMAAAWVTLATEVVAALLAGAVVTRALALRIDTGRVLRTAACAALAGGLAAGARALGAGLAPVTALLVAAYVPLVLALRVVSGSEVRELLRASVTRGA